MEHVDWNPQLEKILAQEVIEGDELKGLLASSVMPTAEAVQAEQVLVATATP